MKKVYSGTYSRVKKWLLGCLTPAFAVCLAVGLFLYFPVSSGVQTYAADVSANPLINSNIGKHGEWYYGLTKVDVKSSTWADDVAAKNGDWAKKKSSWMSQIGLDGADSAEYNGVNFTMTERDHKLVQAEPYKDEKGTEKVFTIDNPEDAARVWAEAIAFALGESADSPFDSTQDKSKDLLTGEVQTLADGSIAQGNYFADPYLIDNDVPYSDRVTKAEGQWTYAGKYITVKLNCDWYAKPIQTNILFTPENFYSTTATPAAYQTQKLDSKLSLWTTTFNWTDTEENFSGVNGYWNEARQGYSDSVTVQFNQSADAGVNAEGKQNSMPETLTNRITDTSFEDGYQDDVTHKYYASYDLCINADDAASTMCSDGVTPHVIHENVTSPFSFGRINVPTGAYIVLDLNGHTISRDLADDDYDEIQNSGSILKERYEYPLGIIQNDAHAWVNGTDTPLKNQYMYGNPYCYYGNVIEVQPKARLEVVDSTAYERASDGRINRLNERGETIPANDTTTPVKGYKTNHEGTIMGGCADQKYVSYVDWGIDENGWSTGTKRMADLSEDHWETLRVESPWATWGYTNNEGKGGCVHGEPRSEFILHSGTLSDSQAQFGGAIYLVSNAAMIIYNGYIIGNYATLYGGGVYLASASRSVFTVYDGVISYNRAAGYGGGIALRDTSYVNIHDGDITYNIAGSYGGGVHIGPSSQGLLENTTIRFNKAGIYGGGIYVDAEATTFKFAGALIVTDNVSGLAAQYYHRDFTYDGTTLWTHTSSKNNIYHISFYSHNTTEVDKSSVGGGKGIGGSRVDSKIAAGDNGPSRPDGTVVKDWTYGEGRNAENNLIGGVIWKNKELTGGSTSNLFLACSGDKRAKIVIGGSMFQNGINAKIGITLQDVASWPNGSFTSEYSETNVDPNRYFTSDDEDYYVAWSDNQESTGGTGEAALSNKTKPAMTGLTWRITGTLYGGKEFIIVADGKPEHGSFNAGQHVFKWDDADIGKSSAEITSFLWTESQLRFDHKMYEVTKVEALSGEAVVQTWDISHLDTAGQGVNYSFHYLLEKNNIESELIEEGGEKALIYAGDYSFRVTSGAYSNTSFTITINQLGVGVSAYEVKNGEPTWHDKGNPFANNKIPSEQELRDYIAGALYYRGTAYDFVLDKAYREGKEGKYKGFTGAVMKFVYANTDFFGKDVEIDFGAVDFDLEYYWRELNDKSQSELEKTNYFLHAGFYEVRGAHEVVADGAVAPSVDYMKNNIAFQSEMHLPIQRVSVSVWLENNACVKEDVEGYFGYTFKDAVYTTKQILYFNNNDEAGNDPELDPNVTVKYYQFDDYLARGANATEVGIEDNSDGSSRWGVKDAGKYVVHVSLNAMLWREGDEGKDDFTPRGKPYNDYIFTSNEKQRLAETSQKDEQGRDVVYEFAYYFFIQPAEIENWTTESVPDSGEGSINLDDRVYNATDDEPTISGRYHSSGADNGLYNYPDMTDDTVVQVRYLSKEKYSNREDVEVTADDIEAKTGNWTKWDAETKYNGTDKNGNQLLESKFRPVDAGEYWILVHFRGVMPEDANNGANSSATKYTPVANFKGVYIGTYTIKPVEVTVTGSLSYTYDGSSYERARYLPPRSGKGEDDAWYESIFFLVQDGITTPSELITNQHADSYTTTGTFSAYDGGAEVTRDLTDLWGKDNTLHNYDDATYHKNRFTLGSVSVNYSNEEFKQHEISFGIGLYAFKTKSADQGNYHLSTVDADAFATGKTVVTTPRVTDEPEKEGATWIITYQPKDGKQVQAFNTSQNFVISSTSFLDVTINQKNLNELAGDITKVGIDSFKHWSSTIEGGTTTLSLGEGGNVKTGISYPFAGNNWQYTPGVTVQYQPFYYAESVERTTGRTAYGTPLTLNGDGEDYTISYMNNSNASTASNSARITLNGQGNYTGSLTLDFTITPAQIAVQYAGVGAVPQGVGAVPQYDKTAHSVNVTYTNAETDDAYSKYLNADPKILVGNGEFKKPQPDASVYSITYKARTRTAAGFGAAASPADITDGTVPIEAGVYDVKIVLGSDNYQFVSGTGGGSYFTPVGTEAYKKTATGSHTILPAVVSYKFANNNEIYNRAAHTPTLTFTNITYEKNPTLRSFQNVVPQLGSEYTVTINGKESEIDAGNYTVKVQLSSHNYCFSLTVDASGSLITGYKDGSTGEDNYPSCEGSQENTYNYTVRDGNNLGSSYPTEGSWTAPGDYVIQKATITLDAFKDSVYNRAAQPQTPVFSNKQSNNAAVPTHNGQNAGVPVLADEFKVEYVDNNVITPDKNSCDENGNPFYAELYSVKISLTEAGAKNFKFETRSITQPHFAHSETATDATLLTQRLGEGEDASVILAPFLINRVDITVTQLFATDVYNAKDHFHAAGAEGIALTNWVSAMFQYASSEAIQADDLTVDVIFKKGDGATNTATVHYTPTTSDDTVEYGAKKDYTFEEFAKVGFFTHVATYTVTVKFSEESFYITTSGADEKHLSIPFTYNITPAQISFSLNDTSVTYDRQEHKPTIGNGIVLTNSVSTDEKVLPTLATSGDSIGIGEVWVTYGYDGWAGKTLDNSNGFKNAGSYTVTLTLHGDGGDFRFADNSYSVLRNYTIERRDISSFTPTYQDDETLKDHAGSAAVGYHYTGSAITPTITLSDGDIFTGDLALRSGAWDKDEVHYASAFEATYTDNLNAGEAKVTMTGVNNFTGSLEGGFLILPAIVNVTASDNSGNSETFEPDVSTEDKGSLTFSYNKTAQTVSFAFKNLCDTSTLPNSSDYVIEYYKAADWDEANSKPKDDATAIEGGVTDSGSYFVWIRFQSGDNKEYSNFVFYKEHREAGTIADMFPDEPFLFAYKFAITVTPAQIQIHLSDQFKGADGRFTNTFPYTATDYTTVLNSVTLSGEGGITPVTGEYTVEFYTESDAAEAHKTNSARNADHYYLVLRLIDEKGNYQVTGVYVGSGSTENDKVPKVETSEGNGYYADDESLKNISVHFVVETAKIEVYLSSPFKSDSAFNNSFGYDRSDWRTRLNPVTFKNELSGGVVPGTVNVDYQVTFLKDADATEQVLNAGSYTLKFGLIGDDAQNFVITHVRAGKDGSAGSDYVELTNSDNYTTTDDGDMRAFDVAFTVTPANIEIHLADRFKDKGAFVNSFVYTRQNLHAVLSVVSIKNANNVVPNGTDYTVSFKTELAGEDTTTVTNVGKYYLIFKFSSDEAANNYNVTAIYAGNDTSVTLAKAESADGAGYFGSSMEDFSVKFDITPAQIEVYLSEAFRSGEGFVNSFGFNKNDWTNTLNSVQFKNELRNGIFPQNGEYTAVLKSVGKDTETDAATVRNVGTYKLVITLVSDGAKNFEIVKVYAGTPSNTLSEVSNAVELSENAEKGYVKTASEPFTAFSVQFKITPAEIQVHVPEQFRSAEGAFVNEFGFNKSSWASVLNAVTLSGKDDIVPTNSEYTVTFMLKDSDAVDSATDVGDYRLVFTLTDDAGNYVITAIYAGTDDTFDVKENAGDAYHPIEGKLDDGTLKKFSLAFKVTPAEIDLYLNGFVSGSEFTSSFVYDGTNQSSKLGSVDFANDGNITPSQGYSVTFYYDNVAAHAGTKAKNNEVFDAGKYFLHFELLAAENVNKNYKLRNVYAGPRNGSHVQLTSEYRDKTETGVYVDFSITPSVIDVFFSAATLKNDGAYVNKFYYNRNDWTGSFGSISLDAAEGGAVPQGAQYSVEYYKATSVSDTEETWDRDNPVKAIYDVGRYSVTFRLSREETGHYPGVKHYNNYTIRNVYAGGTKTDDSVELQEIDLGKNPTDTNGYRKAVLDENNVYVTLVFDIIPNVVKLQEVGNVVYNDGPQDANYTFVYAGDGTGAVLPDLSLGDFTATYSVNDTEKTGNERFGADHKPYFAGAYTVSMQLTQNFIFATEGRGEGDSDYHATRNFRVTPVVLSPFLGFEKDGFVQKGENSLVYDGVAHEYKVYTDEVSVTLRDVQTEGTGGNVYAVREASYDGWAKDAWQGYTNAGTYTVTLKFYIFDEDGNSTEVLGGNFCFGSGVYTISLTYAITQRTIGQGDVFLADGKTLAYEVNQKIYTGRPQTDDFHVLIALTEGAAKTELKRKTAADTVGDYSISNTSDINVGHVDTMVTGMNNYQGSVNLSYDILPAEVTATIDKTSLPYNAQDQSRSFTFTNESGTGITPAYNTNENSSDYTIKYTFQGQDVKAPHNAGEYTVTVTLHNLTGVGNDPNFKFKDGFTGKTGDYTATFTFTVEKAEIYLAAIPGASYTGEERPATVTFVNSANSTVLPKDYDITYDDLADIPTHVKTNGDRKPVAYNVKVTLKDVSDDVTGAQRDLSNFKFVTHESATYTFDTEKGEWGQEAYVITPAIITGSLSVTIDDEPADVSSNVYNTKKHNVSVAFRNAEAGFTVVPKGTMGEAAIDGLVATYEVKDGETLLYTFKVAFAPSWVGFNTMDFDGIPENAGAYVITVDLVCADFSFAKDVAKADWTYTIANAKIKNAESLGTEENSTTFTRELVFAPDNPHDITLTSENFKFIDKEDGFNASKASFTFTSCTGAAYDTVTDENGLQTGYCLKGAGLYTIAVTVDAPNHDQWAITLKVTVKATAIELTVGAEAKFSAVYGDADAYSPEKVLEQVLKFIREGKITVEGISGTHEEQANTLVSYGFGIGILAIDGDYSGANRLKVGDYGLKIDKMEVSGFEQESFIVFKDGGTEYSGKVFTVTPLAITISTKEAINDLRYNGTPLVNVAAENVVISNRLDGDAVEFESVRYNKSEGGNFNNGSVFEATGAIHVGKYWVHVFSDSTNGLFGADAENYFIEEKDETSDSIRYMGNKGVYVAFEIKRREVELAIADSSSVYGDDDAVYGTEGKKQFHFTYTDNVLSADFGRGEKVTQLDQFVLDLLALFNSDGTSKLEKGTTPYPGAGSYLVKLDPDAGKDADWLLGEGRFNFDDDFILRINSAQSGKHTIEKRAMRVSVHDYSSYYGETLKEDGFEGSEGAWGFTALDGFVKGDSEKDLGITITLNELAFTEQDKTKDGQWWDAMTYVGGLTAVPNSANYSVTFTEGTGNYIVMPRPIIVLIGRQTTVYGETILRNLSGLSDNWAVYGTKNDENMGYADGDTRSGLKITLTLDDVVNETAPAGVYTNVIKGSCGNPNYKVTFRNWVTEGGNEPGDREGGDYEITKRSVAIRIGVADAIYGTDGIHVGSKIELTAPVYDEGRKLTNAAQWTYDFDLADYTILTQDLGYLTFYLGKAAPASPEKLFATEGTHAIVGVWGFGYAADMTFMKSYDVKFYGEWDGDDNYKTAGIFTVKPADIIASGSGWEVTYPYRQKDDAEVKDATTGWYPMAIAANYLTYAGDYKGASAGELVFNEELSDNTKLVYDVKVGETVLAQITYAKPTNTDGRTDVERVGDLWYVHSVGEWDMTVTVTAKNHRDLTETLTYRIISVVARVSLNTAIGPHTFTYGEEYPYLKIEEGNADYNYTLGTEHDIMEYQITKDLNAYLLNMMMISTVDGMSEAYPDLNAAQRKQMIIDHCHVEVVDAGAMSSAGLLRAGTYSLRIVAEPGCGFTVAFMDSDNYNEDLLVDNTGTNRLIVEQKEVGIKWAPVERELHTNEEEPNDGADAITYIYSSYPYDFKPLFTGVIGIDGVERPDSHYYDDQGTETNGPKNVGKYSVVITNLLKGEDEANYKLPEVLTKPLIIEKMKVKVTVYDRTITYGEDHPAKTGSDAWTYDRLGEKDYVSALGVTLDYIDENGAPIDDKAHAGVYGIRGTASGSNYDVEFFNADGDVADAVFTILRSNITIHINSYGADGSIRYGDNEHMLNFTVDAATPIASWDTNADLKVELTVGNGHEKDADSYYILGTWTNKDYNVTFEGDWTGDLPADYLREGEDGTPLSEPQGAGTYVISPLLIKMTMQPTKESYYGDYSFQDGMGAPTFYEFALSTIEPVTGYDYAYEETAADLKLTWTLPESNDVGVYTIKAVDNDNNYIIDFDDSVLVWTVVARPITVTIHTQRSTYGNELVELVDNDLTGTFWTVEGLAPWHTANPYEALLIHLSYDGVTDRSNAGVYGIHAEANNNTLNYLITYQNDDKEEGNGTYVVDQRKITLDIKDFESTFGDYYEEDAFNALIVGGFTLAEGSTYASWDAENPDFVLGVVLTKAEGYHVGVYPIRWEDADDNYEISVTPLKGFFTISKAENEWLKHFSLESMNEGETPDAELLSATAKFGKVTVKYYYDALCLFEVTDELNALSKSTYYAKITVDDTLDYTGLEEVKAFVVNESFLVVNGTLDVTLYLCIFASQFIILTFALIFIRRRKTKDDEPKGMK